MGNIQKIESMSIDDQKNLEIRLFSKNTLTEIHIIKSGFDFSSDFLVIYCENGKILVPSFELGTFTKVKRDVNENWFRIFKHEIMNNTKASFEITKTGVMYSLYKIQSLPHYSILDNFVESILTNSELIVTPEEGLRTVEIVEKIDKILKQ